MIKSIQKRFTKKICYRYNISSTSYFHGLNMLNVKSLEYRGVEFDLMFMHKIIHGYADLHFSDFFSACHSGHNLRRNGFRTKPLQRPCTEHLNDFFLHRARAVGSTVRARYQQ